MLPWWSISAVSPGGIDGRRVVLLDHGRPGDSRRRAAACVRRRAWRAAGLPPISNTTSRSNQRLGAPSPPSSSGHSSADRGRPRRPTFTMSISASKRWPYSRSWAPVERLCDAPTQPSPTARAAPRSAPRSPARLAAVGEPVTTAGLRCTRPRRAGAACSSSSAYVRSSRGAVEPASGIMVGRDELVSTSVASSPVADVMPGWGGTSTRGISSSRAMSHAYSGPRRRPRRG